MSLWQEANRVADRMYIPKQQRAQFLIDYMNNKQIETTSKQFREMVEDDEPDWLTERDRRREEEINQILRQSGINPVLLNKYRVGKKKSRTASSKKSRKSRKSKKSNGRKSTKNSRKLQKRK